MKATNLETHLDFRGGLNLRADPFELNKNESPDLLNVDIDPRGGIEQRRGIREMAVTVTNPNRFTVDESTAETSGAPLTNLTRGAFTSNDFVANGVSNSWVQTIAAPGTVNCGINRLIPVVAATQYSGTAFIKGSVARSHVMKFEWYNAASALISTSTSAAVVNSTGLNFPAVRASMTATSPALAAFCKVVYTTTAAGTGDSTRIGGLYFALGQNDGGYLRPEIIAEFDSEVQSIFRFETSGGIVHTLVGTSLSVWLCTDSALTNWQQLNYSPWGNVSEAVQFKDKLYIFNGLDYVTTWDGTNTGVITTQNFVDDLSAPAGANMVFARHAAVFQGSLWIANTNESAQPARTPNRVRWSHPNFPESWRSFDFIDIDVGHTGDSITALVPLNDKLLVFKQRSVYAITGTGPENFAVYPISTEVGAMHRFAVAPTAHGVYFFSWPDGVFLYDGKSITWQFGKLKALIDNSHIPAETQGNVRLGWSGRRLWVAAEYRETEDIPATGRNNRCYIMDPALSKEGSWTAYDATVSVMRSIPFPDGPNLFIGGSGFSYDSGEYLQVLEDPSTLATEDTLANSSARHISSHFTTPWMDQKTPTTRKRFRAPEFILRTVDVVTSLPVELRIDFHDSVVKKLFTLLTRQNPDVLIWGTGVWGDSWQSYTTRQSEVARGSSLGLARAVQLKINGPSTNHHWGLNGFTLRYTPRPR